LFPFPDQAYLYFPLSNDQTLPQSIIHPLVLICLFVHIILQIYSINYHHHLLTPLRNYFESNYHLSGPLKSCHSKCFGTTLNSSHYYHHLLEYHHLSNNLHLFPFAHLSLKYFLMLQKPQFLIYFNQKYSYLLIRLLGTYASLIKR
jgi:hypothetical protein